MKKLALIVAVAVLVCLLAIPTSATNSFTASYGTPTLDGEKDACYTGTPVEINFEPADDNAATGTGYVAWDESNIYFYCEVEDNLVAHDQEEIESQASSYLSIGCLWSVDGVEFYISFDGELGLLTDVDAGQFTYGPYFPGFAGQGLHRDDFGEECTGAYKLTENGYAIEICIPAGLTLEAGKVLPMAAGIDDNDDPDNFGNRAYHTFTGPDLDNAWQEVTAAWDSVTLLPAPAVETDAPAEETQAPAEETQAPTEETQAPTEETQAPAEETEAPSDNPSPVTADIAVIAAGIALAAAAVVVFKKH